MILRFLVIGGERSWEAASKPKILFGDDSADKFADEFQLVDGTDFTGVPQANKSNDAFSFGDFDGDGDLDIFAVGKDRDTFAQILLITN